MPQADEIRAQLVKEIERRQQQLDSLRDALASLDAALDAAAAAHAASLAAIERSLGAQVAAATRMARSSTHAVAAAIAPPPAPVSDGPATPQQVEAPRVAVATPEAAHATVAVSPAPTPVEKHTSGDRAAAPTRHLNLGRYANMKVWRAVQHILTEQRRALTLEEIVRFLYDGGASLGESPMRTVSTAVGYMNDKIFHVSKSGGVTTVSVLQPFQ